jgi:hypothetical protein
VIEKIMRSLAKSLLWIVALAIYGVALAQTPHRFFTFDISVEQDTFKVGSQIALKIQLKNTSDHDITRGSLPHWDTEAELIGFRPIVRDAQGKEPLLTKWGRRALGRQQLPEDENEAVLVLNAVGPVAMHPGEILKTEIRLNSLYDLVPGKYTVQVQYYDDENKEAVKSKTITLTVVT